MSLLTVESSQRKRGMVEGHRLSSEILSCTNQPFVSNFAMTALGLFQNGVFEDARVHRLGKLTERNPSI